MLGIAAVAFWPAEVEVPPEEVASVVEEVPQALPEPLVSEPSPDEAAPVVAAKRQAEVDSSLSAGADTIKPEPTPPPNNDSSLSAKAEPAPEPIVEQPQEEP